MCICEIEFVCVRMYAYAYVCMNMCVCLWVREINTREREREFVNVCVPVILVVYYDRKYYRGKYPCMVDLLFNWFGSVYLQIKTKIVSSHTADSKPVKQEVNSTLILPFLVFPD